MFRVGQKVTLKDNHPWDNDSTENVPVYGVVYTVRTIEPDDDGGALLLSEIRNSPQEYEEGEGEATFDANEFRPVIEKSTDTGMAILREILDRESVDERVPDKVRG